MDSNHRLVLFTHALYRLSYPAVFFAMWLVRPDEAGSVSGSPPNPAMAHDYKTNADAIETDSKPPLAAIIAQDASPDLETNGPQ